MNNLQKKIQESLTRTTKVVLPHTTNHHDTLFGGTALQWMDEAAFITATRFTRQKMVTVSIDQTDFKIAIPAGYLVELVARVSRVGTTSVQVVVEVYKEHLYSNSREKAIEGTITMVAVDEDKKPMKLNFDF